MNCTNCNFTIFLKLQIKKINIFNDNNGILETIKHFNKYNCNYLSYYFNNQQSLVLMKIGKIIFLRKKRKVAKGRTQIIECKLYNYKNCTLLLMSSRDIGQTKK